ncbi:hypothetical protein HDU97_004779 [Phlyctochytrium planicorne]|nr:hypothetical protein HDU97_004779 [Phlyctochytrium planicorne]
MVAIQSIIIALTCTISAVSAIALPESSPAVSLKARSFDGNIGSVEPIMMLMHCNLSKDGQVLSQFSDIGLYETLDSSRDGSIPAHYVGPNAIQGLTDFSSSLRSVPFNDGRDFISGISDGGFNVPAYESIGTGWVGYRYSENTYQKYIFDCFRDNGRRIFGASSGENSVECFAFGYCTFTGRAIA